MAQYYHARRVRRTIKRGVSLITKDPCCYTLRGAQLGGCATRVTSAIKRFLRKRAESRIKTVALRSTRGSRARSIRGSLQSRPFVSDKTRIIARRACCALARNGGERNGSYLGSGRVRRGRGEGGREGRLAGGESGFPRLGWRFASRG
jgi:hypothetical protein